MCPTTSLADDVAATKRVIAEQKGPVILVGHSYGVVVITEAGNDPSLEGLVYITAFAPDRGESVASLIKDPPSGAPVPHRQVRGQVVSVAGNTVTVNNTDPSGNSSQTTVTVTDRTKYVKQTITDAQALAQGKCIAAHGTTDGGGTLQATAITVQQADNGGCAEPGGGRHRH